MSVKIRLKRMGRTNGPFYRVVAADSRTSTQGRFIEALGWYDPRKKDQQNYKLDVERVDHWVSNGAELSDTVKSLLKRSRTSATA